MCCALKYNERIQHITNTSWHKNRCDKYSTLSLLKDTKLMILQGSRHQNIKHPHIIKSSNLNKIICFFGWFCMSWRNRDFFICCIVQLDDVIGQQDLESKGSQNTIASITWTAVKFLNIGRFFYYITSIGLKKGRSKH